MKVRIRYIANEGDLEKERVLLDVVSKTDIGDYVLFRAVYRDDSVTTGVRNTYWFPNKSVSTGDSVIVYTKSGATKEKTKGEDTKSHFFYWGLSEPIWNQANRAAVILYTPDWDSYYPDWDSNEPDEL